MTDPIRSWCWWMARRFLAVVFATVVLSLTILWLASLVWPDEARAQSRTPDHLTSFCALTWDVPPPNEAMLRAFASEPQAWAELINYLNRLMAKRKEDCRDA